MIENNENIANVRFNERNRWQILKWWAIKIVPWADRVKITISINNSGMEGSKNQIVPKH